MRVLSFLTQGHIPFLVSEIASDLIRHDWFYGSIEPRTDTFSYQYSIRFLEIAVKWKNTRLRIQFNLTYKIKSKHFVLFSFTLKLDKCNFRGKKFMQICCFGGWVVYQKKKIRLKLPRVHIFNKKISTECTQII